MGRFTSATRRRIEREQAEGRARRATAEAIAFSLCWMTERCFYQRLVQDEPPSRDRARRRALRHLGALGYGR